MSFQQRKYEIHKERSWFKSSHERGIATWKIGKRAANQIPAHAAVAGAHDTALTFAECSLTDLMPATGVSRWETKIAEAARSAPELSAVMR